MYIIISILPCICKTNGLHSPIPVRSSIFFCIFITTTSHACVTQQLNPNDLLVAASPYNLVGYRHGSPSAATKAVADSATGQSNSPASRAGLLSTVTDAATSSTSSSSMAVHQPVSRLGNLDWLIHSLNTNLPDPATLIREPNLTPNLKHMIGSTSNGGNSSGVNGTPRSPQHVAFADEISPLPNNQRQSNSSSPARNMVPVSANANSTTYTNNKFPFVSCYLHYLKNRVREKEKRLSVKRYNGMKENWFIRGSGGKTISLSRFNCTDDQDIYDFYLLFINVDSIFTG